MNIQYLIYFSFFIFLIGIFGYIYKKDFVSKMISLQFILSSGIVNFLGFSHFVYQGSVFDKTFIILGLITVEFLLFSLLFYKYASRSSRESSRIVDDYSLFSLDISDWWGEDEPEE